MRIETSAAADELTLAVANRGLLNDRDVAENTVWLEACGYPGLKLLAEALDDPVKDLKLVRDALGLDLKNVSCVYLSGKVSDYILAHGRTFLRNVRHGLFLLPASVERQYGIGCPVDPSFALGGERSKDPYAEKLELAAREGIEVDDTLWRALTA
jgi:hypothetical protein